jgi:hypothetical protein
MAARSNARAALLAATMNLVPLAPIDLLRFLRVPAIVMTIRTCIRASCSSAASHRRR